MRDISFFLPLTLLTLLLATEINAQDYNEEMKKKLRQSLITPENRPVVRQPHQSWLILPEPRQEVLKVSPVTRLPTKFDRIQINYMPEKYIVKIDLHPTNAPPINQRPTGSIRYWQNGNKLMIESTAGLRVVPSGYGAGPIRKRHKKKGNLLKAFQK